MWMQRELIEVAHRTSNLSSKDQASLANTRKALLARRESSFVGKIHIEVLGVGQAANHEWASSFGFQQDVAASDYPWNDVEIVLYANLILFFFFFCILTVSLNAETSQIPHRKSNSIW